MQYQQICVRYFFQNKRDITLAIDHFTKALHIWQDNQGSLLKKMIWTRSERQRIVFLHTLKNIDDTYSSLFLDYYHTINDPEIKNRELKEFYSHMLSRKGIVLESLISQETDILVKQYPGDIKKVKELNKLRRLMAQVYWEGSRTSDSKIIINVLKEINRQKEELEVQLAKHIPAVKHQNQLFHISVEDVKKALPSDSVLVEFFRITSFNFQKIIIDKHYKESAIVYIAFIISAHKDQEIQFIQLGEEKELLRTIKAFRLSVTGRNNMGLKIISEKVMKTGLHVSKHIYAPMESVLAGHTTVFLATDGIINVLPFEIIPVNETDLALDHHHFIYLHSGRELLQKILPEEKETKGPILIGNPDFTLLEGIEKKKHSIDQKNKTTYTWNPASYLNKIHTLPGTGDEIDAISTLLTHAAVFTGKNALKGVIKEFRSPCLLHFATHGFFPEDFQKIEETNMINDLFLFSENVNGENLAQTDIFIPEMHSMLALAGAESYRQGYILPKKGENGLLTPEDIVTMELQGTKLVVLSACKTGVGTIYAGEGVMGLRRAFLLAGVQSVVMSLWEVPDIETKELMTCFYTSLINGMSVSHALKKAKTEMRKKNSNPFFWGGFVCLGDTTLEKAELMQKTDMSIHFYSHKEKQDEKKSTIKNTGEMLLIPAGKFFMGISKNDADQKKTMYSNKDNIGVLLKEIYLDAFYIDTYPVTNQQYLDFVHATGYPKPRGDVMLYDVPGGTGFVKSKCIQDACPWDFPDYNHPDQPVVCITWKDAKAYAEWAGKRLPTEAEWEKAARGTDGRLYPWGNDFNKEYANFWLVLACCTSALPQYRTKYTTFVRAFPEGASPFGVMGMAGNVWEWTNDWYKSNYVPDDSNPCGPPFGEYKVMKGGGWNDLAPYLLCSVRVPERLTYAHSTYGFRCVKSYTALATPTTQIKKSR